MNFETIILQRTPRSLQIRISRPAHKNSINSVLIRELGLALDEAEQDKECRTVVLSGENGFFCTGMDFEEVAAQQGGGDAIGMAEYMGLLKRFTSSPKIIISALDGKVIAGGTGFVAASDLVISTARTEFSLSEALWGLLPCCVIPFLVRRVGFQKAYTMALTTRTVSAQEGFDIQLIDELTEDLETGLRKLSLRLNLLEEETIGDLKRYFQRMWHLTPEVEKAAVQEITRLASLPRVRRNISNYVQHRLFPWQQSEQVKG
jgi:polyketide biosynthesis enoyl-CoA hydratase PksH